MISLLRTHISVEDLRTAICLWILLGILLALSRFAAALPDIWVAGVVILLALPLQSVLFWRRRMRRLAFRQACLKRNSPYFFRIRGGLWMFLGQSALALMLGSLLLVGLARQEHRVFWLLLVILVPVWLKSNHFLAGYFQKHVNEPFHLVLTHRVHGLLFGLCLLASLFAWTIFQPVINVSGVAFEAAVLAFTRETAMRSTMLGAGVDLLAGMDAARHWLGQNLMETLPGPGLHGLIWLMILIKEWLLVWPLLLMFQAVHLLAAGHWSSQINRSGDER